MLSERDQPGDPDQKHIYTIINVTYMFTQIFALYYPDVMRP